MTDEQYRDVPNGYVYLYEQQGWVVVSRGDFVTRMGRPSDSAPRHPTPGPRTRQSLSNQNDSDVAAVAQID